MIALPLLSIRAVKVLATHTYLGYIHVIRLVGQDTLTAFSQSYPVLDYLQALATL